MGPFDNLLGIVCLADWMAYAPGKYALKIGLTLLAWTASLGVLGAAPRLLGIGGLLAAALGFLFSGFLHGALVDFILGMASLGAAAHAWSRAFR